MSKSPPGLLKLYKIQYVAILVCSIYRFVTAQESSVIGVVFVGFNASFLFSRHWSTEWLKLTSFKWRLVECISVFGISHS